ncbi:MerR family transcriptional regulator [Paenibacillaceae bacterium]|nr:MerR family transcriptional regulator [Paenibacillaceae bacterium]
MKIKEVCSRTGLTERTVRFYVEEQLILPQTTLRNGREYREYNEQDVAELIVIADLRKLFFTIEEIKRMKHTPAEIDAVLGAYKQKLAADAASKSAIVEALEGMNIALVNDVFELAGQLRNVSQNLPLPKTDIAPNFGRLDPESKEDRERQYNEFIARQERQFQMGKIIVYTIGVIHIISALVSAVSDFNLFSLILQIAIAIALLAGVTWVRYFYVFGAVITLLGCLFVLFDGEIMGMLPAWIIVWIIVQMVYSVAASILLLRSQAVSDFLYAQKNG